MSIVKFGPYGRHLVVLFFGLNGLGVPLERDFDRAPLGIPVFVFICAFFSGYTSLRQQAKKGKKIGPIRWRSDPLADSANYIHMVSLSFAAAGIAVSVRAAVAGYGWIIGLFILGAGLGLYLGTKLYLGLHKEV